MWAAGGCSSPIDRYHAMASEHGATSLLLQGRGFDHQAYFTPMTGDSGHMLHVYLDGDGTPWRTPRRVAPDPSPRDPLVLKLMLRDEAPTLYLGRPCYLRRKSDRDCPSRYWTSHRYSEDVVASMAVALEGFLSRHGYERVRLIGFSGGGTLAMLMAPRISGTEAVITLAGNLDPDAWTRHHGYLPLTGSLNPMRLDPLPEYINQLHLVGSEDDNILPTVAGVDVEVVRGIDHNCCWLGLWPAILKRINTLEQR